MRLKRYRCDELPRVVGVAPTSDAAIARIRHQKTGGARAAIESQKTRPASRRTRQSFAPPPVAAVSRRTRSIGENEADQMRQYGVTVEPGRSSVYL